MRFFLSRCSIALEFFQISLPTPSCFSMKFQDSTPRAISLYFVWLIKPRIPMKSEKIFEHEPGQVVAAVQMPLFILVIWGSQNCAMITSSGTAMPGLLESKRLSGLLTSMAVRLKSSSNTKLTTNSVSCCRLSKLCWLYYLSSRDITRIRCDCWLYVSVPF